MLRAFTGVTHVPGTTYGVLGRLLLLIVGAMRYKQNVVRAFVQHVPLSWGVPGTCTYLRECASGFFFLGRQIGAGL